MELAAEDPLQDAILRQLGTSAAKATFVAELRLLAPPGPNQDGVFERSLNALEAGERILVRAHSCADPHMALVDLRIASLIEAGDSADGDQIYAAVKRDQSLWDDWVTEFLRNHRCQG